MTSREPAATASSSPSAAGSLRRRLGRSRALRALGWLLTLAGLLSTLETLQIAACLWGTATMVALGVAAIWALKRGHRRAVALASCAVFARFAIPAWGPALARPSGELRWPVETIDDRPSAYALALTDTGDVVVTHAHSSVDQSGLTVVHPDGATSYTPVASPHVLFPTAIPGGGAIVTEWEDVASDATGIQARSYILEPSTGTWRIRDELTPYYRPFYYPDLGLFFIVRPRYSPDKGVQRTTVERFLANQPPLANWVVPLPAFEEIIRHPTAPILYGRGEANSDAVVELDLRYGTQRFATGLRMWHWGIGFAPNRHGLLVTNSFAHELYWIDERSLALLSVSRLSGMPRAVIYVPGLDVAVVGSYTGRNITFLSERGDRTWAPVGRLATCPKVRSLVFDAPSSRLYFTDDCGAHRVEVPRLRWWS